MTTENTDAATRILTKAIRRLTAQLAEADYQAGIRASVIADLMEELDEERASRGAADALERAHPKFNPGGYVGDYTIPEMPSCGYGRVATREEIRAFLSDEPCDDRTCTDRDHWAPLAADPLDESDHRPRHDHDGEHIYCHGDEHWHSWTTQNGECSCGRNPIARWAVECGPLTFCDCDAATIEAENGATD